MLGGLIAGVKVVASVGKHLKPIAGGIKKVVSVATQDDTKDELDKLYKSFRHKLDTDGDGKSDFEKKEMVEFLGEALLVIVKRL